MLITILIADHYPVLNNIQYPEKMKLELKKLKYWHDDIKNILVQLNNIYMSQFLRIKRDKGFNKDIVTKIDALAKEQGRTRSDVIRNILYARFDYEPKVRLGEQTKDYIEERKEEKESECRYIAVRVDNAYRDIFYLNMVEYPGRLDRIVTYFLTKLCTSFLDWKCPNVMLL